MAIALPERRNANTFDLIMLDLPTTRPLDRILNETRSTTPIA